MNKPLRILYFGINAPNKSARDAVYIEALKRSGNTILECVDSSAGLKKFYALYKKHRAFKGAYDVVFVGHMSTLAVPLARLISRKPIIFNALNPLYDSLVIDREIYKRYSFGACAVLIADFLSVHCAAKVLLETNLQIEFVHKLFWVSRKKLVRVFTTVDPAVYSPDARIIKNARFTCVHRGYLTGFTGSEYIIEAANLLRDEAISFRLIVRGELLPKIRALMEQYKLTNIELITNFVSNEELHRLILEGHVYLGQYSTHERLARTIQFKTVEAMAFGLPYITADLPSNRELLHNGVDCLFVPTENAQAIADAIQLLRSDDSLRARLGREAHALYERVLSPVILADQIQKIAEELMHH